MSSLNRVSFQSEQLSVSMITLLVIVIVSFIPFLTLPVSTQAQSDPLNSAYKPTIDTNPSDYPANIWITDTMQKVRQDSGSPGSAHWGTFYGTQNEFVDFQVHVQAPSGGYSALTVTAGNFVQSSPGSSTISASSTNITVYREAYIDVTTKSATSATFYNATGYYPDILIPTVDPYYHQTTNAWPVAVTAGQNQSAWIDVLIPPSAPSGYYLGSVTVKSGSTTLATMPVVLAVWQWPSAGYMPSTATLKSMSGIGWNDACTQFYGSYAACGGDPGVMNTVLEVAALGLDHRWSLAGPVYGAWSTTAPSSALATNYGPLYNGTTAALTGILSGAKEQQGGYYNGNTIGADGTTAAQNWATIYSTGGWSSVLYDGSCDEPEPAGYGTCGGANQAAAWGIIAANATVAHAVTPPIPTLVTVDIGTVNTVSTLYSTNEGNNIDWMVPNILTMDPVGGSLQRSAYNTWLAGSSGPTRKLLGYFGCSTAGTCSNGSPGSGTYPNYDADGVPAANRVNEWLTFLHTQSGELYYIFTNAWEGGNDPWSNIYYFGNNGDGTLVYPSTAYNGTSFTQHVTQPGGAALTNPIFLPSVRLKHMRDGMQDYEYLNVLTNNGQSTLVATEINSWITNSYTFETTGSGLEAARSALGTAMHQITYPLIILPPSAVSVKVH